MLRTKDAVKRFKSLNFSKVETESPLGKPEQLKVASAINPRSFKAMVRRGNAIMPGTLSFRESLS